MTEEKIGKFYERRKFHSTPRRQDLGNPAGFFSKFLKGTAVLFVWESPPPPPTPPPPDRDELEEYLGPCSSEGVLYVAWVSRTIFRNNRGLSYEIF